MRPAPPIRIVRASRFPNPLSSARAVQSTSDPESRFDPDLRSEEFAAAPASHGGPRGRIVLVQKSEIRRASNGKNFASLTLNQGAPANFASIGAKIWDIDLLLSQGLAMPAQGAILEVAHREETYNNQTSWILERWRELSVAEREEALRLFVQPERIDSAFYRARLDELIEATAPDSPCGAILREVFDRPAFRAAFLAAPAASTRHQNYPGGLLEHTINVTSCAIAIAAIYSPGSFLPAGSAPRRPALSFNHETLPIDRDVLVSAGLLHDIGKVETYAFRPLSETTDANNFEGHLPIGYAVVRELAEPRRRDPAARPGDADSLDKLLNCILSHHGRLEFGSPVPPCCAEAFILSQADVIDARVAEMTSVGHETIRQSAEARWARVHQFPSGVFVGDWPRPPR